MASLPHDQGKAGRCSHNPAEAIQDFALAQCTGTVTVERGHQSGEILLVDGDVVHAHYGSLTGQPAALALMNLTSAQVRFRATEPAKERSIKTSFMQLVCEAARDRVERPQPDIATPRPKSNAMPPAIWPNRVRLDAHPGAPIVFLDKALSTVGRSVRSDIVILHNSLSNKHAFFRIKPSGVVLSDLESRGGTFVRGQRISDKELHDQDSILFGEFAATYLSGFPSAAATSGVPETTPYGALAALFEKFVDPETEWHEIQKRLEALGSLRPNGPHLIVLEGGDTRIFPLAKTRTLIGRDPQNDVSIRHDGTSRNHAEIIAKADGFYVRDCGSSNGTFARGKAIQTLKLAPQDRVFFGAIEAIFLAGDPHARIELAQEQQNASPRPAESPTPG